MNKIKHRIRGEFWKYSKINIRLILKILLKKLHGINLLRNQTSSKEYFALEVIKERKLILNIKGKYFFM
jgi:hypothetical protein